MTYPHLRLSCWWRAVRVALALILAVLISPLHSPAGYASQPVLPGTPCPASNRGEPTWDELLAPQLSPCSFDYDNPYEALRDLRDNWDPVQGPPPGTTVPDRSDIANYEAMVDHLFADWERYKKRKEREGKPHLRWEKWFNKFIPNQGNESKGDGYEELNIKQIGFGSSWLREKTIFVRPDETNKEDQGHRTYDVVGKIDDINVHVECKFGTYKTGKDGLRQLTLDVELAAKENNAVVYLGNWTKGLLDAFNRDVQAITQQLIAEGRIAPDAKPNIHGVRRLAVARPRDPPPGSPGAGGSGTPDPKTGPGGPLSGVEQLPATGAAAEAVENSPNTPEEAAQEEQLNQELAAETKHPDAAPDLGGVDFSTLELRYISDTDSDDGPGADFAFQAKATADGQLSYGGARTVKQASDSFFVWLALPPEKFTVNLNPTEPDRIVDADLGRTDAGRVLLEADFQLKKTTAKLIHPDTALGAQYWSELEGMDEPQSCNSFRSWIMPATASVREDQGQLYILDAPLDVRMETDYLQDHGTAPAGIQPCERHDAAVDQHNEEVFRSLILPKVVEAVNTAPEYQDLRRVFYSRVAAQWIRERSTRKTTAYTPIINSGDIDQWALHTGWRPKDVFDAFVKSYRDHEFNVTRTTRSGNTEVTRTYIFGGVDFTASPRSDVGETAFKSNFPNLASTVNDARFAVASDASGESIWLGGTAGPDTQRNGVAAARAKSQMIKWVLIGVGSVVSLALVGFLLFLFGPRKQGARRPAQIPVSGGE